MKHLLLTLFALWLSASALSAQGNLQFNQAKYITSIESVPSGKVWKLVSFTPTEAFRDASAPRTYQMGINGTSRVIGHSAWQYNNYATSGPMSTINLPLWFSAGTSLDPAVASSFVTGLNIIEFNLIP
jgi:hypothetical protein